MRVLFLAEAEKDRAKLVQIEKVSYMASGRVAKEMKLMLVLM